MVDRQLRFDLGKQPTAPWRCMQSTRGRGDTRHQVPGSPKPLLHLLPGMPRSSPSLLLHTCLRGTPPAAYPAGPAVGMGGSTHGGDGACVNLRWATKCNSMQEKASLAAPVRTPNAPAHQQQPAMQRSRSRSMQRSCLVAGLGALAPSQQAPLQHLLKGRHRLLLQRRPQAALQHGCRCGHQLQNSSRCSDSSRNTRCSKSGSPS